MPAQPPAENVVYLTEEHGIHPGPPGHGTVPPNPHAYEYEGVQQPTRPESAGPTPLRPRGVEPTAAEVEEIRARAARIAASLTPGEVEPVPTPMGSHGPLPAASELVPPPRVDDNPFGDFFADGPSAWLEDEHAEEEAIEIDRPRILGTLLAAGAVTMLVATWVVWGVAMYRGAGGAEAGGFLMLSMLLWVWYLAQPRRRQHAFMLRRHASMQRLVDRRVAPLRERTEGQLAMRRERDRYRAMRDERTRRVSALGEGAYRIFRLGQLPAELHPGAQRVLAIERQMLAQDQRIHALEVERGTSVVEDDGGDGHGGSDPAADPPESGHPGT